MEETSAGRDQGGNFVSLHISSHRHYILSIPWYLIKFYLKNDEKLSWLKIIWNFVITLDPYLQDTLIFKNLRYFRYKCLSALIFLKKFIVSTKILDFVILNNQNIFDYLHAHKNLSNNPDDVLIKKYITLFITTCLYYKFLIIDRYKLFLNYLPIINLINN